MTSSVTDDSPTLQTDVKWVLGSRRFQIRSMSSESVVGADLDNGGGCWARSGLDDDKLEVEKRFKRLKYLRGDTDLIHS